MATTKHRINISLSADVEVLLTKVAKRDGVPEATKASALLRLALEIEEDAVWDKIAHARDMKSARFVSHKDSWK